MLQLLIKSLTSLPCIIGAIRQLLPANSMLQTIATRALDLVYMQSGTFSARVALTPRSRRETPKSLSNASESVISTIDRSALLPTKPRAPTSSTGDDTDSDVPLRKRLKEKTKAYLPHLPEPSNDLTALQTNMGWQPHLQTANNKRPLSPNISDPTPQKKHRVKANDPSRISTALPTNDPPQGPHCHCYANESDQTLVKCDSCEGLFVSQEDTTPQPRRTIY